MANNEITVRRNYEDGKEEYRSSESRYNNLEFYYTEKHISEYIGPSSSVIELGCGTGYYAMRFSKKCKEYIGIDITPENIEILNRKIFEFGLKNVIGKVGDATKLENIPNQCFDVVLCLGPLYHLSPNERELVFAECKRICKNGGIAVFAYINKIGVYTGACVMMTFGRITQTKKQMSRF